MTALIFNVIGGIGLFLLGMVLLTDGLKSFAGDALRGMLVDFTGTPLKAFGSGALITALVQSSSATTVAVIGFVSAGLLNFPQSVGVVLGASLGTTATSWLVAVLGLTVSVGFYALPVVGVGVFMRLLGRGRMRALGLAVAGFGLIFVGIQILQDGMHEVAQLFDLQQLPQAGFIGPLLGMVIGTVMTIVMQSSSAAVATTLTALHTGAVSFEQAAAIVIGAAIGTTVTSALASIGATVSAKRTALAHVLFNLATGLIAIVLLPVLLWLIGWAQQDLGLEPGAMSLAAFHSVFIAIGVALFLPNARRFAHWIERRLADSGPELTRNLDPTVLTVPTVALEATRRALTDTSRELFGTLRHLLDGVPQSVLAPRRARIVEALEEIQSFFATIPAEGESALSESRIEQMHAIDHLLRLRPRLAPPTAVRRKPGEHLAPAIEQTRHLLETAEAGLAGTACEGWVDQVREQALALTELRRHRRPIVMHEAVGGRFAPGALLDVLDAMRWLERVGYHAWRVCHYLGGEPGSEQTEHLT